MCSAPVCVGRLSLSRELTMIPAHGEAVKYARATIRARAAPMQHPHAHTHDHHASDHAHPGHSHGHGHAANERSVGIAALLTGGFMLLEIAGGVFAGSLALLADAGHMLTDFASLALA